MADMNKVILIGNLTRDPQLRRTPSGTAVGDLGLAVSDKYKNRDGELVERTCFVDIVVWGRQAETSEQYLRKGSPVLIEGRLDLDTWETERGEKRSKLRVNADRVQFLSTRSRSDDAPSGPTGGRDRVESSRSGETSGSVGDDAETDSDDLPF